MKDKVIERKMTTYQEAEWEKDLQSLQDRGAHWYESNEQHQTESRIPMETRYRAVQVGETRIFYKADAMAIMYPGRVGT